MDTIEITKNKLNAALVKYATAAERDLTKVAIGIFIKDGIPSYELTDETEKHLKELKLKEIFSLTMSEKLFVKGTINELYQNIEKFLIAGFGRFALSEKDIKGQLHAYIKIRKIGNEPEAFLCDDEKFIKKIEISELIKTE